PLFQPGRFSTLGGALAGGALVLGEAILLLGTPPAYSEFKAVYAPMNTQGAEVVAEVRRPRGHYLMLDNFTERVDADVSNNASMMDVEGRPSTYGLYRDGSRIAGMLKAGGLGCGYADSAVSAAT